MDFLKQAAAGGIAAPFFVRNLISAPPGGKLRLASFGAGGMAYETLFGIARHPNVTLVCAAEVDSTRLKSLRDRYPDAQVYTDWRQMLDKERKNLDIVCVGTPDHMHAPMAMSAMQLGLHVYVQKPLTHDIYEARQLTEMARKKKLVTQMGIQIHSSSGVPHGGAAGPGRRDRQGQGSPHLEQQEVGRPRRRCRTAPTRCRRR